MRLSTKIGATISSAALGVAAALGGAGVAQAQSLGSLGQDVEAELELAITNADAAGAEGTLTNNTEFDLECYVGVAGADVVTAAAEGAADVGDLGDYFAGLAASADVTGPLSVAAGGSVDWDVVIGAEEDFRAGAIAYCEGGDDEGFAVDFEAGGFLGSLDMGSLGS